MSATAKWSQVVTVFEAALEYTGPERVRFINKACRGDAELLRLVLELVKADKNASELFTRGPIGDLGRLILGERVPADIGPYRVIRVLGRGGMGLVCLAERRQDYHRQVAIKILDRVCPSPHSIARFMQEREILSSLEHPNVARLYDGGVDPSVGLYLVMEYIEGLPIDEYCASKSLSVRETLRTFLSVCSAVSFAHRNLIVHRDLKPSNIYVAEDGTIKLLDFGIAKWIDSTNMEELSASSRTAMTPAYASPEQVKGTAITTASDLYSLGIVLFELLTGRRPYALRGATPGEIANSILNSVPIRPSEVILEQPSNDASRSRQIRGDVDKIVLKCLSKDPELRYSSVESLAEDISLHLQGRPIKAKGRGVTYVARKFLSRHRATVFASAAALAAIVGILVVLITEQQRYEVEQATAEGLTSYLVDLFEVADPALRSDTSITADDILTVGRNKASSRLSKTDRRYPEVLLTLGRLYTKIGEFRQAKDVHLTALRATRRNWHTLRGSHFLGLASAERRMGHFARAESELDSALAEIQHDRSNRDRANVKVLFERMLIARELGLLDRSDSLADVVLRFRRKALPENSEAIAEILEQKGMLLRLAGRLDESERYHLRALSIYRRQGISAPLDEARVLNSLGMVFSERGEYKRAESAFKEALRIKKERLGELHPSYAITLLNLSPTLEETAGPDSADAAARKAIDILEHTHGLNHPDVSMALNNLGLLMRMRGDLVQAESLYRRSLAIASQTLPPEHLSTSITSHNLAVVLRVKGDLPESRSAYQKAIRGYRLVRPWMDLDMSNAYNGLGKVQRDLGRAAESIVSFRECLSIRQERLPATHWRLGTAHSLLGEALARIGEMDEAEYHLRKGIEILTASRGPRDQKTLDAIERLNSSPHLEPGPVIKSDQVVSIAEH